VEYKIFQFPADKIPLIDGNADDWAMVPESYSIRMDQLKETVKGVCSHASSSAAHGEPCLPVQVHGVHARMYHIFTPAPERDWALSGAASHGSKNYLGCTPPTVTISSMVSRAN
jgi:hypothetical protein